MPRKAKGYYKHELDAYRHPKLISLRLSGHGAAEPFYWAALSYIYENHAPLPCDTSSLDFVAFCHDMCCDFATAADAIAALVDAQLLYRCEGGVSSERAEETLGEWEQTSAKRSEAGSKGGRPQQEAESKTGESESKEKAKGSESKANGKQKVPNQKQKVPEKKQKKEERREKEEEKEKEREGARGRAARAKHGAYGNVLLSGDELAKLKAECPADWAERIERLDEYIEQTGRRYRSHLATIRAWKRRDTAQGRASPARGGSKVYATTDDGEGWMPE